MYPGSRVFAGWRSFYWVMPPGGKVWFLGGGAQRFRKQESRAHNLARIHGFS
jgi:hypothetical protein